MLAHIVGISYFVIALIQIEYFNETKTWLHDQDLLDRGWFEQYINSLYWSFSTMVSNVYYTPVTQIELIFTIIAILIMTGMFGYVLNTIGMLLNDIEKKTQKYKLLRDMSNRFMKKRHIPEILRERVFIYLEYIQQEEKQKNQQEEDLVLSKMSEQLRKELLQHMNNQYLKQFSVINDNFSEETKKESLLIIKEQVYSAGDNIYKVKDRSQNKQMEDNLSIYVLLKGTVELYYLNKETDQIIVSEKIHQGQIFGSREFFTGEDRQQYARSSEACSVIKINRNTFLEIINRHQEDKQLFNMIKDQILMYNTSEFHQLQCNSCQQQGHIPKDCEITHYKINLKQLIYDYNFYCIQIKRNQFGRYSQKSINALLDLEYVQYGVEEIFDEENGAYESAIDLQEQLQSQNNGINQQQMEYKRSSQRTTVKKISQTGHNKMLDIVEDNPELETSNNQGQSQAVENEKEQETQLDKSIKKLSLNHRNSIQKVCRTMIQNMQSQAKNDLQNKKLNNEQDNIEISDDIKQKSDKRYKSNSNGQRSQEEGVNRNTSILGIARQSQGHDITLQRKQSKLGINSMIQQQQQSNQSNDIDMQGFDKLKNWSVYWIKHNYEEIVKNSQRKCFIKTEVFSEENDDGFFNPQLNKHLSSLQNKFTTEFQRSLNNMQGGDSTSKVQSSQELFQNQNYSNNQLVSSTKKKINNNILKSPKKINTNLQNSQILKNNNISKTNTPNKFQKKRSVISNYSQSPSVTGLGSIRKQNIFQNEKHFTDDIKSQNNTQFGSIQDIEQKKDQDLQRKPSNFTNQQKTLN